MDEQRRLAVLVDADNAQPSVIGALLEEVAKYGTASVKRIYGDFTSTRMNQWKQALLRFSINPVQQFAYTSGKNATDSALIIDAMDLLYTRRFDGFCLVTSDSDFTRLAQRLREEGLTVYGFGEKKTPDAFIQACDKFIYTELLRDGSEAEAPPVDAKKPAKKPKPPAKPPTASAPADAATPASPAKTPAPQPGEASAIPLPQDAPLALIRRAVEEASDERGWANLAAVGAYLTKVRPDFDPRLYGHRKLSDLLRSLDRFFAMEDRGSGPAKTIYVRAAGRPEGVE
ncbi:NYN domain-containing protein [Tahibacter soli]|uniref:NYN domain-containing protein n=1 Tax=Tahibacter soli TaxID=2983605 RepID=A0A9X3YPN5_9GAMM|nr:NYN domain-containing protein [Tahibacter soli]MDC8016177.1 NYN domain-containing protein [Tahibacter soli]